MSSWVLSGGRSGQVDRASANSGGTHNCTYNSRKRGAEPLLVVPARNQEKAKQQYWPCLAGDGLALAVEGAGVVRLGLARYMPF